MPDFLCILELPSHGQIQFRRPANRATDEDMRHAVSTFGPLICNRSNIFQSTDTYLTEKNVWVDAANKPKSVGVSQRHAKALTDRCRLVNDARLQLSSLQLLVPGRPRRFLTAPSPPPPSGGRDARLDGYANWLMSTNAAINVRTLGDNDTGWSPVERRFRAAADILAGLPRPAKVLFALVRTESQTHFAVRMTVPQAFQHFGLALMQNEGRIEINRAGTVSAPDHASLLSLSHFAAFIAALARYDTDPRTTLTVDILLGTGKDSVPIGKIKTKAGHWNELARTISATPTTKLEDLDGLIFQDPVSFTTLTS